MSRTVWAVVIAVLVGVVGVVERRNPGSIKKLVRRIRDDWYQSARPGQRPTVRR